MGVAGNRFPTSDNLKKYYFGALDFNAQHNIYCSNSFI